tara:strand:+ start:100 stop:573 length:474 start_codon:yes stop_codon:yes gene_type:complete
MAFSKGNEIWRMVEFPGRPRKYDTPELLWEKCLGYFDWVNDNPFIEHKATQFQGVQVDMHNELQRPMTKEGLTLFVGVHLSTWIEWSKPDHDFSNVVNHVNQIIYDNKFSGATAGFFNSNIIARDLGLADKKDHLSSDASMSPKGLADFYADAKKDD